MRVLIVFFALLTAWKAWRLREILAKRSSVKRRRAASLSASVASPDTSPRSGKRYPEA